MRALLLALVLSAISLVAQPTISNQAVDNVTAHGARFAWTTNVASTAAKIKVGTADPPSTTILPDGDGSFTTHVWFASGLTAGTLYYWQVCSTSGSEACTTSDTFMTLAAGDGIATLPTAPTEVTTTYPTINGTTDTVASDCSNLQSKLTTFAGLDGDLNHLLTIPAGTECVGRYSLPTKTGSNPTGSGFVVLESGGTLAPDGSRTSATYATPAATIVSNFLYTFYQTSDPGTCNPGDIVVRTDTFAVKYCTSTNTWTAQTVTTGAGAPSSTCTANAWYRNTLEVDTHKAFWWCTATNKNRNLYIDANNNYVNWAGLYTSGASVKGYRVVGLKIQDIERPTAYTSLLPTSSGSGDELPSKSYCLAYTQVTDSYVFFDRVYFDGQGQPHRQQEGICFMDGSNMAVINSYFNEINTWRPTSAGESTTNSIFMLSGVGPMKFENNYFGNTTGMAIFQSDDNVTGQTNDVVIRGNQFFVSPTLNLGEPTSNGLRYGYRHHVELKRGKRWLIHGNTFTGGFPTGNGNSPVLGLTPRNGSASATQCRTNTIQISDIDFRYNKILYVPQGFLMIGHNDGSSCNTMGTIRVAIRDNVIYSTGTSSTGNQFGLSGLYFNGQVADTGLGFEDVTFTNNVMAEITSGCCSANMWSFAGNWSDSPNSRWNYSSNIYMSSNIGGNWGVMLGGGTSVGTASMNTMVVPNSTYQYKGNARQRGITGGFDYNNPYPSGNYDSRTVSDFSGAVYQNTACGDEAAWRPKYNGKFAAGSSTARGYDGFDSGPNFVAFDAVQGCIYNLRALSVTDTTATIAYTAPSTSNACTVEYGTSATVGTGTRVTDTPGGSRFRSKAITGLTGGTTYYYRVYCGQMASSSFQTN